VLVSVSKASALSPREAQVVLLILDARPIKEIALEMGISRHTVTHYLRDLYAKLGIHTRAELTLWAMNNEIGEQWMRDRPA
jgi:DNA-binding CsgD family transcriptional regulator